MTLMKIIRLGIFFRLSLAALVGFHFVAYKMLNRATVPIMLASSTTPQTTINIAGGIQNISPSYKLVRTPTKSPMVKSEKQTFQPTNAKSGWRVKVARKASHENSNFWKKHAPDSIPPLPSNNDPISGEKLPPIIAYVTTLTKCNPKQTGSLDGAAVLLHSIRRNSYGWAPMGNQNKSEPPLHGGQGGRYRFRAYVLVDPAASPNNEGKAGKCARFLQKIGYIVLHRPPLVPLFPLEETVGEKDETSEYYTEFKNLGHVGIDRPDSSLRDGEHPDKLRQAMYNDGCCGYTELLKLHVYGMVEHELAVHLDFDSLLLQPMDDLFDAMLAKGNEGDRRKLSIAHLPKSSSVDFRRKIDAAFTRDYNSVKNPSAEASIGFQGGFLAVRPSLEVLERYRDILRKGDFHLGPRDGWEGKVGGFYGDATFQGILPYYYEIVAPRGAHNEVELDRCVFNQMGDNPRKSSYKFPRATPLDGQKMVSISSWRQ